jgi:hypothetical protein
MTDESGARPPPTQQPVRRARQVEARLQRIAGFAQPDVARRGRVKLMFDVLDGIAGGAVEDPARVAAAVIAGINRDELFGASPAPAQSVKNMNRAAAVKPEIPALPPVTPKQVLNYLYKKSRWHPMSRTDWETAVRTACSISSSMRTSPGNIQFNMEAVAEAFGKLKSMGDTSTGILMMTFHGAFHIAVLQLFTQVCEAGTILAHQVTFRKRIKTTHNSRDALFTALRALQEGHNVLMSPDGMQGRRCVRYKVLGGTLMSGDGAAFLAHTANCNTAWFTVVREGDRFIPVIEPGPRRHSDETPNEFSQRLKNFYAEKVEGIFAGDPRNIVLMGHWIKPFMDAWRLDNRRG